MAAPTTSGKAPISTRRRLGHDRYPYPYIQMNPEDMKDLGLSAGDLVEIHNDNGATQAMAYPTPTARRKQAFMLFAYPMGVRETSFRPASMNSLFPTTNRLGRTFARSPPRPERRGARASSRGNIRSDEFSIERHRLGRLSARVGKSAQVTTTTLPRSVAAPAIQSAARHREGNEDQDGGSTFGRDA